MAWSAKGFGGLALLVLCSFYKHRVLVTFGTNAGGLYFKV
jgi:hypothetical protein